MKVVVYLIFLVAIVYGILIFDESFMAEQPTHVMKVIVQKPK